MSGVYLGELLDCIPRRDEVRIYSAYNSDTVYWTGSAGQTTLPPKFYGYEVTKIAASGGVIEIGVKK